MPAAMCSTIGQCSRPPRNGGVLLKLLVAIPLCVKNAQYLDGIPDDAVKDLERVTRQDDAPHGRLRGQPAVVGHGLQTGEHSIERSNETPRRGGAAFDKKLTDVFDFSVRACG